MENSEILVASLEELERLKIKLAVLRVEIPINLKEKEDSIKNKEYFDLKIRNTESALRHTMSRLTTVKERL